MSIVTIDFFEKPQNCLHRNGFGPVSGEGLEETVKKYGKTSKDVLYSNQNILGGNYETDTGNRF